MLSRHREEVGIIKAENLELEKRDPEAILLLAAKEREPEKAQWDLFESWRG